MEKFTDKKIEATLESAGTAAGEAATAAAAAAPADAAAADIGTEDAAATDTATDATEETPDAGGDTGDTAAEPADEGPLLSEPAQRDDWYQPVTDPKWKQGARKRSYLSSAGNNLASSSHRNLFKGWSGEMGPLSRGTVGESQDRDENHILETQHDIKQLIAQLETKDEEQA